MPSISVDLDAKLYHFNFLSALYTGDSSIPIVSCPGNFTILQLKQLVVEKIPAIKSGPPIVSAQSICIIFQGKEIESDVIVSSMRCTVGEVTNLHLAFRAIDPVVSHRENKKDESHGNECGCILL